MRRHVVPNNYVQIRRAIMQGSSTAAQNLAGSTTSTSITRCMLTYAVYPVQPTLHSIPSVYEYVQVYFFIDNPLYHRSPSTRYNPLFLFSASHRSTHAFIRSRLFRLPTFTVGITRPIRSAQQNIVNSRNELCSLYGTPKQALSRVLPRCGTRSRAVKGVFQ